MRAGGGVGELIERIRVMAAKACDVDPARLSVDGKLLGYGLDSVRALDLIVDLEAAFGIEIPPHDEALAKLQTVRLLAEYVARRVHER